MKRIAAMVLNDRGQLLPFTCQGTIGQCEEWCEINLLAWNIMKNLGAKIVQVEITVVDSSSKMS